MKLDGPVFRTLGFFVTALNFFCLTPAHSDEPPPSPEKKREWFYQPRVQEIWARANPYLEKQESAIKVLKISEARWENDPAAKEELALVRAKALVKIGLPLSAQRIYTEMISRNPLSGQSQAALHDLAELIKTQSLDEEEIEKKSLYLDVVIESESGAAMIAFFKWKALVNRKMTDWADRAFKQIPLDSIWRGDLDYANAVALVAHDEIDDAILKFEKLTKDSEIRPSIKQLSNLQLSRLLFERRDFMGAFKQYQILDLPQRERGRALLEMAWSQYYMKNYAESLGILYALRNPVFDSARSPERLILEMLILRDLCHYEKVRALEDLFHREYDSVYRAIESRSPFEKNNRIASLVLLDTRRQYTANLIHALRVEMAKIKNLSITDGKFKSELIAGLVKREADLRFSLDREIFLGAKKVADTLIDQREQIKFIGYSATIQSKNSALKPGYDVGQIPVLKYDTLYWPVRNNEFWWDEISYYRTLIKDNCGALEKK